jgi:hypothetical protein
MVLSPLPTSNSALSETSLRKATRGFELSEERANPIRTPRTTG